MQTRKSEYLQSYLQIIVQINGLKTIGIKNKQACLSTNESKLLIGPFKRIETLEIDTKKSLEDFQMHTQIRSAKE